MNNTIYHRRFFEDKITSVRDSADAIVPLLIRLFEPKSVVDFGCGIGLWLATFKKHGVNVVLGLDGDWVKSDQLKIAVEEFSSCDLALCKSPNEKFDMAVSLEVGEHLPPEAASDFVEAITATSEIVVFSAAIPFQGGSNHVNEQWPDYWAHLFEINGFQTFDILRPLLWDLENVEPHYAQNILVYVKASRVPDLAPTLGSASMIAPALRRIHPRLWESKIRESLDFTRFGTLKLLKALPVSVKRSILARFASRD